MSIVNIIIYTISGTLNGCGQLFCLVDQLAIKIFIIVRIFTFFGQTRFFIHDYFLSKNKLF